jgi:hypothetical protein
MEGTATWIEDEVFDGIDDNVGYLRSSPLTRPLRPLDRNAFPGWYGTWVWFRFLAEQVGDRRIVRDAWEAADGSAGDPNRYSTEATVAALPAWTVRHHPLTFGEAFAAFGAANVRPDRTYEEGGRYPPASTQWSTTITTTRRHVAASAAQDHLTNRYARIRRGAVPGSARLRIVVDAPPARTDPHATLVAVRRGGGVRIRSIPLDRTGAGRRTVAFGRRIAEVVVVTTNASTRFVDCGGDHRWRFSCAGTPLDDGVRFSFVATLLRARSTGV